MPWFTKKASWTVPIAFSDQVREELYRASIDSGNPIDTASIMQSKQRCLPILAETEAEFSALTDSRKKAVEGDVDAICDLIISYELGVVDINKSAMKAERLRKLVLDAAVRGNRAAQAACTRRSVFGEILATANKSVYEPLIRDSAKAGDRDSQFAVGMFLEKADSFESLRWLYEAAMQGNSDAAYHLIKRIDVAYYSKGLSLPEYGATFEFIKMGAEANNGVYASNLQEYVADAYAEGECGVDADKLSARSWYKLAIRNGGSSRGLDFLDQAFIPKRATPIQYLTLEDIKTALGA